MPRAGWSARRSSPLLLAADIVVLADAEEGEIVVGEPFEEGDRFGRLPPAAIGGGFGLVGADRRIQAVEHRPPVADGEADLIERLLQFFRQRRAIRLMRDPVEMNVDQTLAGRRERPLSIAVISPQSAVLVALQRKDRVSDELHFAAIFLELAEHRIDEERHVVIEGFDDGDRRSEFRVAQPDQALPGPAPGKQ